VLVNPPASTPTVSPAPSSGTQSSGRIAPLPDIFSLDTYPYGLLIAAIFGLAPGLLLGGLQQQSDKYKEYLKSSQATTADRP
jgi:hypothetical protein